MLTDECVYFLFMKKGLTARSMQNLKISPMCVLKFYRVNDFLSDSLIVSFLKNKLTKITGHVSHEMI